MQLPERLHKPVLENWKDISIGLGAGLGLLIVAAVVITTTVLIKKNQFTTKQVEKNVSAKVQPTTEPQSSVVTNIPNQASEYEIVASVNKAPSEYEVLSKNRESQDHVYDRLGNA